MARRTPYTKVEKENHYRPEHVVGGGDVVYRRFECMNPDCSHVLTVLESECTGDFAIQCPVCDYLHFAGGSIHLFDYRLINTKTGREINEGPFSPLHADYIAASERVKYCILCCTMQPLQNFGRHESRPNSRRQGECKMCKDLYNDLKNETRLTEQHREAADTRRLLRTLSGETEIRSVDEILDRFEHQCFNCTKPLSPEAGGDDGFYLDHTLPVSWLWPLDYGPTVLCRECNGEKSDHWPSEFYKDARKLRALAARTGIPHDLIGGPPMFFPDAVARLRNHADEVIERWVQYPDKLKALRTRILAATGEDVFSDADPASKRAIGLNP